MSIALTSVDIQDIQSDPGAEMGVVSLLRQVSCLCHLPDHIMEALAERTMERRVVAGETVFGAGQYEADDIFICIGGEGRVTGGNVQEGSILRRSVREGDFIGLDYVLSGIPERAGSLSLQASTHMHFLVIESDAIREVVASYHQAAVVFLREMARQLVQHTAGDGGDARAAAVRISKILCDLAEKNDDGEWVIPSMPLHRELGAMAEASEKEAAEAVARFIGLNVLKRQYPGMVVADYPALMAFAE